MLPYLEVFGLQIPMYGLCTAFGGLLAIIYFVFVKDKDIRMANRQEMAFICAGIGAAVGAKLLYYVTVLPQIVENLPMLFSDPMGFLRWLASGGLVFYGGFYGCVIAVWLYCKVRKLDFDAMARVLLPLFPIIHGFGRIGCFCVGCCYGMEVPGCPLAVTYENALSGANGVPLLPVQLFEAGYEFILFGVLAALARKQVSGKRMLAIYCVCYGIFRFILEFFRGDEIRGFLFGLSTSQIISVFTLALAAFLFWQLHREKNHNA